MPSRSEPALLQRYVKNIETIALSLLTLYS